MKSPRLYKIKDSKGAKFLMTLRRKGDKGVVGKPVSVFEATHSQLSHMRDKKRRQRINVEKQEWALMLSPGLLGKRIVDVDIEIDLGLNL